MHLSLKEYQKEGIAWLRDKRRAILGDEAGVGKSAQAIFALYGCNYKLVFVVCPASLRQNWKNEFRKWGFLDPIQVFEKKKEKLRQNKNIAETLIGVFSYETFVSFAAENPNVRPDVIIFDEAHKLKDRTTKRAKTTFELARKIQRVWFLTGTPLPNNISDAWTLFYFCSAGTLPKFWDFSGEYGYVRDTQWGRKAMGCRSSRMDELVKKVKPFMLRRTVSEVLPELPEYEEIVMELTPCKEAKVILDKAELAREALRKQLDGEELTEEEQAQLVSLSALRSELGYWKAKDSKEFIQNFIEQNEPVVIGVHHQSAANYLISNLSGDVSLINGVTPMKDRQPIVDSFQEGKLDALVLGIQAAGLGITLTRARIEVLLELTYVPTELSQFQARIRRLGQRQSCLYYFMVYPGTIDELVYERVLQKAADLRKFYNAYEGKPQETEKQEEIIWDDQLDA